jgi:PKD repeat protein
MTGLPNVIVNDFEIFYPTNKLRAATYGRGIWQSDLFSDPAAVPTAYFSTAYSSACINTPFLLSDQSSNMPTAWTWSLTGASPSTSTIKNPTVTYNASGVYTISLISTNGNGASAIYTSTISVIAPPTITLTATASCNGQPANLSANGASTYVWSSGSTGANTAVTPSITSVYTCTGSVGACNSTKTITVNVGSVITPTITQNGLVLTSSASAGNQWYLNGSPISGETSQTYTVTQSGYYSVWVTSAIGCQSSSTPKQVTVTGLENNAIANSISLSPNPAKDVLFINVIGSASKNVNYSIYSIKGQLIKNGELLLNNKESISISDLAAGVYEIKISMKETNSSFKFIKE